MAEVLMVRQLRPSARPVASHGPARHWTVLYNFSGWSSFELRGTRLELDAGSVVVFRRDERQTVTRSATKWESYVACFDPGAEWPLPDSFERCGEDIYRTRVRYAATRQRIREAFGRMIADARMRDARKAVHSLRTHPARPEPDQEALRQLLAMTLREIFLRAHDDRYGSADVDTRVRAALERVALDLGAPHTLRSISRAAQLSPSRFGHLFRAELGISPLRALRLMRLEEAALQLRHTQDSVERIAEATGFASSAHLSREFRRQFGVSPRRYRADA